MIYLITRCKACERISTGQTENIKKYIFKCRYCGKSARFWDKKNHCYNLRLIASSNSSSEISKICQAYKGKEGKL